MPETMELTPLEEASKLERKLRRERAEISHRIAEAAATVRDLRGGGHRDGDPVLEEAKEAVGALVDRESVLPQLILDAVAERCRLRAEQLAEEERELARAAEPLQDVAARAHRAQEKARRKANE